MRIELSTFRQDARAVVEGIEFEVPYDPLDTRAFLRLPDYTTIAADVAISGMDPNPDERGYPGRFVYDCAPSRPPFLLHGRELWGQSILRPGVAHRTPGSTLLALWTWDPADSTHPSDEQMKNGAGMPQRRAVLDIKRAMRDGIDDDTAAALAGMAHQVDIEWHLDLTWPPCPNTGHDMDERCACGRDHYAPW